MKSLRQLKKAIARERNKLQSQREYAQTMNQRKQLTRELNLLKSPTKRKLVNLSSNLKKNTKYIGKSLWGQIKTQARLIKEQNERERKEYKTHKHRAKSNGYMSGVSDLVDF
jgi:hypothetical protein